MARRSDMTHDLPVLGDVDGRRSANSEERFTSSRQSSMSGKFPPSTPGPMSSRRTPTPSKQIALQSVRRREESKDNFDVVDLAELNSSLKLESERSFLEREQSQSSLGGFRTESPKFTVKLPINQQKDDHSHGDVQTEKDSSNNDAKEQSESSSGEDDDEDDGKQKEDSKAPNQLLLEFLDCLMKGDFQNAAKLCQMILMYEPNHQEALKFQPLIQERLILNEAESDSDDSGSDEDDDDDEDDDSDDDSDGDSDNSDAVSTDNDEDRVDSGISSAHSNCNSD